MDRLSSIIVSSNCLAAKGLQHILVNMFNMNVEIQFSTTNIPEDKLDDTDLIFVDADSFAHHNLTFASRRHKTIILTANDIPANDSNIHIIDQKWSEEAIINIISKNISKLNTILTTHSELSKREIDVLKLVVSGHINKEIADILNISINTVLSHRKNITSKLGIKSVSGLSVYAMMNGYITSI